MIKLIASDMDGTILQGDAIQPSEELFSLIRECRQKNIWVVIASGRQYPTLRRMFSPVGNDVIFAAENGALIMYREKTLLENTMQAQDCLTLMRDIEAQPGCEVMVSCKHSVYVNKRNPAFIDDLIYNCNTTVTVLDDMSKVEMPILKVSAYAHDSNSAQHEAVFAPKWGKQFKMAVSGEKWLDFGVSTKGNAIVFLQQMLGITRDETLTLGDNYNDVPMFNEAAESYLMQSANPLLRPHAAHLADTVEGVLKNILATNPSVPPQSLFNVSL